MAEVPPLTPNEGSPRLAAQGNFSGHLSLPSQRLLNHMNAKTNAFPQNMMFNQFPSPLPGGLAPHQIAPPLPLPSTSIHVSGRRNFRPVSSTAAMMHTPLEMLGATAVEELKSAKSKRVKIEPGKRRNSSSPTDFNSNGDDNGVVAITGPDAELEMLSKTDSIRLRIQGLVEHELRMRYPFREDWQKKCKEMAAQLEEVIFRNSKTLEEYTDESTLSLRLVEIFMARKKKDILKNTESKDTVYFSILDKARTRWLTGEEITILLTKCSQNLPCHITMNDPAFLPVSGTLFHFGSAVTVDGYNWLKAAGTNMLQEHRFMLTVGGHPRVWVSLNVDILKQMHRRTYWMAENTSIGVLVHYLSENPQLSPHTKTCFCLSCLFKQEDNDEPSASGGSKSSRKD